MIEIFLPTIINDNKQSPERNISLETFLVTVMLGVFLKHNGTPLQYSCLANPMDRGAWWAAVHGISKSQTQLSDFFHFSFSCIGEGNGNPLQCSCLENPRDWEAWWAAVSGIAQSQTRLMRLSSSSSIEKKAKNAKVSAHDFLVSLIQILFTQTFLCQTV